jgi:hypothetical protein
MTIIIYTKKTTSTQGIETIGAAKDITLNDNRSISMFD